MTAIRPARIFFAMGPSPNMRTTLLAPGESDALASAPYQWNRRHLQSQDADGEGAEILDASDDPAIIDACSKPEGPDTLSLCETNGYENAVRLAPFQTRTHYTQPHYIGGSHPSRRAMGMSFTVQPGFTLRNASNCFNWRAESLSLAAQRFMHATFSSSLMFSIAFSRFLSMVALRLAAMSAE